MAADTVQDEERVLVVAPTARDAQLSQALFAQAGLPCAICQDLATFGDELGRGAGAVVLTEEALAPARRHLLLAALAAQPIWSDLPVILLAGSGPSQVLSTPLVRQLGNVLVLGRPISTQTLLGVVQMALRTRRRQYAAHIVAEAGLLLAGSPADDATLAAVVALLVPRLADCCLLYALDTGAPRLVATAFAAEARLAELRIRGVAADAVRGAGPSHAVAPAPGAPGMLGEHAQAVAATTDLAEAHLHLLGATAQRVLPLQTHSGMLGVLSLGMLSAGRPFPDDSRQVVQMIADRVAVALDQARLHRALRISLDTLETRVQERTAALAAANRVLQDEIAQRKRVEEERTVLLERVLMVQEEERLRISRDLHDQLGQQITGLLLGLKQLEQRSQGTPLAALIPPLQAITGQVAKDTHRITVALRPTMIDELGLVPALERLVTQWSAQAAVPASFIAVGLEGERLAPRVEITLYRVVQEALTNVGKYAEARTVAVVVERHRGLIQAVVEDDGRGFAADAPPRDDGRPRLGLLGMRERVAQVGGTLEVESAPGSGTTIFARIPLDEGPEQRSSAHRAEAS
jgi:signal transduction histidine kinase